MDVDQKKNRAPGSSQKEILSLFSTYNNLNLTPRLNDRFVSCWPNLTFNF